MGVITHFLFLPGKDRVTNVINRLKKLSEEEVESGLERVMKDFSRRHRNLTGTFSENFNRLNDSYKDDLLTFSEKKRLLLGSYFTKEYSIQSAALFNPSIVPHPSQQDLQPGEQRFIMSLRATGEGHISSLVFQTGIVDVDNEIKLDELTGYFTSLKKNSNAVYRKDFFKERVAFSPGFNMKLIDGLPESFTAAEAVTFINQHFSVSDPQMADSIEWFNRILDTNYELEPSNHLPFNEKVIFPNAKAESMGIEDARFVKFSEGDDACYYATYTAYNGHHIKTQLIETKDFDVFKIRTLYGDAISDKGMALFPEKINGKYVLISRQGGEKINIMFSEDLYVWDTFQVLMEPVYNWELVQLGNCGSPVKTEKGWLLLTHGVGEMRKYVISAILLDLDDPTKIIGRLNRPLLEADETEREGYVPNVVYTCGLLQHGNSLIIPYAVSDSATGFVTIGLDEILNELLLN